MPETNVPTPLLGEPGDTCRACGAALAVDQRYCLNCGARRAGARIDFHEALGPPGGGGVPAAPAPAPAAPARSPLDRLGGLWPAAVVVLLALALGVLIGRSGRDRVAPLTQAPPVVNVTQAAGGAPAPAATAPADATATTETAPPDDSPAGKPATKAKKDAAESVSGDELKQNEKLSGKDYTEKSKKLPSELETEGKPPPEDDKAPGGGSEAETIG